MNYYPAYDEHSECPKCGHDRALSVYHPPSYTRRGTRLFKSDEYIVRECIRCRAHRYEAPLNPEPTP